jgi:LAO/AO transport system kinase
VPGVGQSEYAVASMVDFFLVLMLAGAGDELQGMKKGILELADALAINKADGDNLPRAQRAAAELLNALRLFRPRSAVWQPPVLQVSSLEQRGMDAVWDAVQRHRTALQANGELAEKRRAQQQDWLWAMIDDGLKRHFLARADVAAALPGVEAAVLASRLTPTQGARQLLALLDQASGPQPSRASAAGADAAPARRRGS